MLILQATFILLFLTCVFGYLRINNRKEVIIEEDESDSILFIISVLLSIISIAILFYATQKTLDSSAQIINSYSNSIKEFWINILPIYGKIIITIIIEIIIFTFLSRICSKQIIKITDALTSSKSSQEKEVITIFLTASIFLGLVIVNYQFIENLSISYIPVTGNIN